MPLACPQSEHHCYTDQNQVVHTIVWPLDTERPHRDIQMDVFDIPKKGFLTCNRTKLTIFLHPIVSRQNTGSQSKRRHSYLGARAAHSLNRITSLHRKACHMPGKAEACGGHAQAQATTVFGLGPRLRGCVVHKRTSTTVPVQGTAGNTPPSSGSCPGIEAGKDYEVVL